MVTVGLTTALELVCSQSPQVEVELVLAGETGLDVVVEASQSPQVAVEVETGSTGLLLVVDCQSAQSYEVVVGSTGLLLVVAQSDQSYEVVVGSTGLLLVVDSQSDQ
jgi:hypothetical protein